MKALWLASVLLACCAGAVYASGRNAGRMLVLKGEYARAAAAYADDARYSDDPALLGEYAYALAGAGYYDLAFSQLDRGAHVAAAEPRFVYFAAAVLSSAGLAEAGAELGRPTPSWLDGKAVPLKAAGDERPLGRFKAEFSVAKQLLEKGRYFSAAYRFHRLTRTFPDEPLAWTGYAIALEKIGAYKTASQAVAKDAALDKGLQASARKLLEEHQAELAARAPLGPVKEQKPNEMLKGRYLCYVGGNYTHNDADTALNINARAGKYLTDHIDAALNAGLTSSHSNSSLNGADLGASVRYQQPLPVDEPVSATLAGRVAYQPSATGDKTSLLVSPGLSYFVGIGSLDFYIDLALSGPLKNTQTFSLGYTAYFGGPSR